MIRGTTPTVTYGFPFATSQITKFRMYFIQGQEVVIEKTEADCTKSGNNISAELTQEETFKLSPKKLVQCRARFVKGGKVYGTKPKNISVESVDAASREVL